MNASDFQKKAREILRNPAAYGFVECALCGREQVAHVGIWFTEGNAAKRLKTPKGKIRTVFYGLCEECASKGQESADAIEKVLFKDLDEGTPITMLIK